MVFIKTEKLRLYCIHCGFNPSNPCEHGKIDVKLVMMMMMMIWVNFASKLFRRIVNYLKKVGFSLDNANNNSKINQMFARK